VFSETLQVPISESTDSSIGQEGQMITYAKGAHGTVKVKLDRRVVGAIRPVTVNRRESGYQYFPKGQDKGGQTFSSLEACKTSLEGLEG
jgi:hypothetical protein